MTYFMRDVKSLPRFIPRARRAALYRRAARGLWRAVSPALAGVGFVAVLIVVQGVDDWALRPAPLVRRDAATRPPAVCPEGRTAYSWRADAGGKWQTVCGPAKALSGGGGLHLQLKPTKPP